MRMLPWLVLFGLLLGCRSKNLALSDNSTLAQRTPGDGREALPRNQETRETPSKWEKEVAECLPKPVNLDFMVFDSFTVRQRLRDLGAQGPNRTLVDANGKVIYQCHENIRDEVDEKGNHVSHLDMEEVFRFFMALVNYSP